MTDLERPAGTAPGAARSPAAAGTARAGDTARASDAASRERSVLTAAERGSFELETRVVVGGRPATFAAHGETLVEAYGRLRALAPEQRVVLAVRALVDERVRP